mmetsp:Transcript_20907/g.57535  ORF Transcript_20907/g.57535 Transcript_20907/m.57535 type:complete len:247 (+) Transcript_20907:574-1314(+)
MAIRERGNLALGKDDMSPELAETVDNFAPALTSARNRECVESTRKVFALLSGNLRCRWKCLEVAISLLKCNFELIKLKQSVAVLVGTLEFFLEVREPGQKLKLWEGIFHVGHELSEARQRDSLLIRVFLFPHGMDEDGVSIGGNSFLKDGGTVAKGVYVFRAQHLQPLVGHKTPEVVLHAKANLLPQLIDKRTRLDASGPDHHRARDTLGCLSFGLHDNFLGLNFLHRHVEHNLDLLTLEVLHGEL